MVNPQQISHNFRKKIKIEIKLEKVAFVEGSPQSTDIRVIIITGDLNARIGSEIIPGIE